MDQSPRLAPWFATLLVSRVVTTGSTVAATAGWRAGNRGVRLCLRRSPCLIRLAVESGTATDGAAVARSELRDELLGLLRDLAEVSWHETRRALDDLDARTRVAGLAVPAGPSRRARVKP